ncbi:protein kinase [Kribbella solani]|uniref:serine/threonine-protein kinase n=2 Tax=Kribbella solani TaxID=236067 RepID=UPI0029B0D738|nr:protein kinase [Kribbella solani]MDX3006468.1 protein kinase [Kribbella solani]
MEAFAGRYRLIDLIGTGGMGSVWRAWDLRRSAYVAAKVLGQHDAGTLLRFVREQSVRIEHPHVVAPHGWAADDDKVVFAMDLVRGGSVATLLGDHGPLPPAYVAVLLDQLLQGLSAVHAAGVVHRDLKPANLLLDVTGTGSPHLRLSDFGVAGLIDEPRMTRTSTILGTPGYLAPEQLSGADPDPRQDLYALGTIATELLTGTRPAPSAPSLLSSGTTSAPHPDAAVPPAQDTDPSAPHIPSVPGANPSATGPDTPLAASLPSSHRASDSTSALSSADQASALAEFIRRCSAPDPADRPASARDAARLLAETGVLPPTGQAPWSTRPDSPEVFDQLPPLPHTWTPTGPAPAHSGSAQPSPAHSGSAQPSPARSVPAHPAAADLVPEHPAPEHRGPHHAAPEHPAPERPGPQQLGAERSPAEHPAGTPVPAEARAQSARPAPRATQHPAPAEAARETSLPTQAPRATPEPTKRPPRLGDRGKRLLVGLAWLSFLCATGLIGSAIWLLLRD